MHIIGRAGIVAAVAALVVLMGAASPAGAVPFKKPVNPYPDLPSQQYGVWVQTADGPYKTQSYQPGSVGYEEAQANIRGKLEANGYPGPAQQSAAKVHTVKVEAIVYDTVPTGRPATNISSLPKPITPPATVARAAAGTAGTAATVFGLGWAAGQGVLSLYAAGTDQDYSNLVCTQGALYREVNNFLMFGMGPDCSTSLQNANAGAATGQNLVHNGVKYRSVILTNAQGKSFQSGGPYTGQYFCDMQWTAPPTGHRIVAVGRTPTRSGFDSPPAGTCSAGWSPGFLQLTNIPAPSIGVYELQVTATGQVVSRARDQDGNPLRQLDCAVGWSDGSSTTGTGGSYKEADGLSFNGMQRGCQEAYAKKPGAGKTVWPSTIAVGSTDDEGARTVISTQTAPTPTPEEAEAMQDTTGKGLVLWKGKENCLTWAADCGGWWEATNKGAIDTEYRCTYGDVRVALTQCYVYKDTFEPEADTDNPTVTDPVTGRPVPWSGNSGQNSTDPATGPSPGQDCMDGWAAAPNPIEWVLHPVKCALVWAFAPRPSKVAQFTQKMDDDWKGSLPGRLGTAVAGIGVALVGLGDGGCGGVVVAVPVPDAQGQPTTKDERYLPACPGDMFEHVAPIFHALISLTLALLAVFATRDQLDRFVGNGS